MDYLLLFDRFNRPKTRFKDDMIKINGGVLETARLIEDQRYLEGFIEGGHGGLQATQLLMKMMMICYFTF